MSIPTEPVGSIPRPPELVAAMQQFAAGRLSRDQLARLEDAALRDTIKRFEATESPVISDGEQSKPSFATYPIHGLASLAPDGVTIPFADGHTRRLPRLTAGPFRYQTYADAYLVAARAHAHVPVKQAVIAASALSLLYPEDGIRGYPRDAFLQDLVREAETDIRRCLAAGAHVVQIDFTEGRLAVKLDPTKGVLKAFVDLNNRVLDRFSAEERRRGLRGAPADPVRAQGDELLHPVRERAGPRQGIAPGEAARQARATDLHRRDRPDRSEGGDARAGARPRARGGGVPATRPSGDDRRLRFRALLGRHLYGSGHGIRQDPRAGGRHRAGGAEAARLMS